MLWVGMSLDGFTSGVNEQLDWLVPHATRPEGHAMFERLRKRCDTILVGRVNYEGFFAYWPKVKDDPEASRNDVAISRWMDEVPKVVFSRTLREVKWQNARLAAGSAEDEVAALKRAPGKDILIQNSTRLTRSLLEAGLVDELNIAVAPVVVGEGRALFAGLKQRIDLRQAELTRFDNGTVYVRYEVKPRESADGPYVHSGGRIAG
jgi:dihydrofolate reductase